MKSSIITATGLVAGSRASGASELGPITQVSSSLIVVSTWPFGLLASERAWELLQEGADALDAALGPGLIC